MSYRIILGEACDPGGRELYEDRVEARNLVTASGLNLAVAVVADGVGGENKGERAAEQAKNSVFTYLERSTEKTIPDLLAQTVHFANQSVHRIQNETGGASTTLAVAVICEDRLFIANVGDSRIYLVRGEKVTQLTMDHTFANIMAQRGHLSWESAASHPRAEVLMRALGPKERIQVDLGFYVGTRDDEEANQRGMKGIPLKKGDSILVCSDGLVKNSVRTGKPFIQSDEISRVLKTYEGPKAAKMLISLATGRGPDDNVSAAVLQTPDPVRHHRAQLPYYIGGSAIAVLLLLLGFVLKITFETRGELGAVSDASTATAVAFKAGTQTVAAYTPTPPPTLTLTPTLRPTLQPGQVGTFHTGDVVEVIKENQIVEVNGEPAEIKVNHLGAGNDAIIYAAPGSRLMFDTVAKSSFRLILFEGSKVFLETGFYQDGARIILAESPALEFSVTGSCMALDSPLNTSMVEVSCYEGRCSHRTNFGEAEYFSPRDHLTFNTESLQIDSRGAIPLDQVKYYQSIIPPESRAYSCLVPFIPTSTPTPRPTSTIVPTGATEQGSGASPATSTPTATMTVTPTFTSRPPTSTHTGLPGATIIPTSTPSPTAKPTSTHTPVPTSTYTVTPGPTSTSTAEPTSSSEPTSTPEATSTLEPTSTPEPTATPTPTPPKGNKPPTPSPSPTQQE